jgi:hypothetical protein
MLTDIGAQVGLPARYIVELYTGIVISAKVTFGREQSITCFVSSVVAVLVPKFRKLTLNLYCNLGINKP